MKYSLNSALVILVVCSQTAFGQEDISVRRKDFKNDKMGFSDAWKHIKAGDDYYIQRGVWFGSAYDEYLKAMAYNSLNPELNYKTGVSALFSDKKHEAAGFLLKAEELKSDLTKDILLLTGRALQYAGRYREATEMFNNYLNSSGKKKDAAIMIAKKSIEECKSALVLTRDTLRIDFMNLGSNINSNSDDYATLFSDDGKSLYFASRRQLGKSSKLYDDTKYDENIWFTSLNNGVWATPATLGKKLTTELCEAPLFISPSGEELYIYTGYENGGDIRVSINKNGKWKAPSSIRYRINTGGAETSFTISPSGSEIWYVTDKGKKNTGGKDIYFIKKLSEKKWSKPFNAGPMINTIYNEESVRFSGKGDTVWFGSGGHNTMGGYDIFYSVKGTAGEWGQAVNAGYPLNTAWDELFYHPVKGDNSTFYFVSNRSGGMGGLDIYKGRLLPPEPVIVPVEPAKPDTVVIRDTVVVIKEVSPAPQPVEIIAVPEPPKEVILYLIGMIKDTETGGPVLARIDLIDLSTDHVIATTASSDVDGSYRLRLPEKKSYMIDIRASGFLSDMKRVNITESFSEEVYNLDVSLIKVVVGKKVVLNNILFETGKSVLTTSSYSELDRLAGLLEETPSMKVEISGHTDNTGSLQLNLTLSESRAKAVVEYLVQKGIDRTRLQFKGYGPQQPIADNATPAGRTQNRRVEFKILEF
jgi:outer membrane protein OmpA-like peptidoglycan-associated protein